MVTPSTLTSLSEVHTPPATSAALLNIFITHQPSPLNIHHIRDRDNRPQWPDVECRLERRFCAVGVTEDCSAGDFFEAGGILGLPNPPEPVYCCVVQVEQWVCWGVSIEFVFSEGVCRGVFITSGTSKEIQHLKYAKCGFSTGSIERILYKRPKRRREIGRAPYRTTNRQMPTPMLSQLRRRISDSFK